MKKLTEEKAIKRSRDETTHITDYGFITPAHDFVVSHINGVHGPLRNTKTTRVYYVISGTGVFESDAEKVPVKNGDIIVVAAGEWATIHGNHLKTAIVCTPPFTPADYEEK
ncbi:MAG: hypothetical protein LBU87_06605 [Lactobacillales bacterium]|jgi:mannose-6-phosphate isomerase-like protein (cupin superfamily)|nr:hypothetical protein [Lactobacillales bacterium]